ncbi:hypothetical protein FRC05_009666 [Tulasnella sp. 425]|nr:hypothetical protein FRC05_009666 [Tulasnella sp. 425]
MDDHLQREAAQDVEFLNLLLDGLEIPLTLTTPVDLTPSLLIAILESIVQDRLPLAPEIRNARDFGSKVEAMKVFLGVLGDDVIGVDIGLDEVAYGEWDETVFVGRVLVWLGGEVDIIDRSELPDFIKDAVAANLTTSTFAQASTNQAPRRILEDHGHQTDLDTAPDPRTRLKGQLDSFRPPSRSFEAPSTAGPSISRITALSSLPFQPDSTSLAPLSYTASYSTGHLNRYDSCLQL